MMKLNKPGAGQAFGSHKVGEQTSFGPPLENIQNWQEISRGWLGYQHMGCVRRGWACWIFPSEENTTTGSVSRVSLLSGVDEANGAILFPEVQNERTILVTS